MSDVESKGRAAVIGAGPAGLMAAEILARGGAAVTLHDRMPSAGRKFLLAGRGGLNLTHSEALDRFYARYGAASGRLRPMIEAFGPVALRAWAKDLGQETFVGTSGRVFPQSFKASPLLRAWLRRLGALGVSFAPRHRWTGWDGAGALRFEGGDVVAADAVVLALGGASWPQLGSDGAWMDILQSEGLGVAPLRPSNCGMQVAWSALFRDRFEGSPLKGVALRFGGVAARGEVTVTRSGLEGGGIYGLSSALRDALDRHGSVTLEIALRPDLDALEIERRLAARPPKQSLSTFLGKSLRLAPVAIGLLQEAAIAGREPLAALAPTALARRINAVPVRLSGAMPIGRAISSAGGIRFEELDADLMLRQRPGTFVAGEMIDWEAPTGGYLLQAAFATGAAAGAGALKWLDTPDAVSAADGTRRD